MNPDVTEHDTRPRAVVVAVVVALGWSVLLCVLLLMPGGPSEAPGLLAKLPRGIDKVVHLALFAIEAALLDRAFVMLGWARSLRTATIVAVLLAIGTEWGQSWVPRRGTDVFDLVANLGGVALAVWWRARVGSVGAAGDQTR